MFRINGIRYLKNLIVGNYADGNYVEIDKEGNITMYTGELTAAAGCVAPGEGITDGTGTIIKSGVVNIGGIIKTSFLLDITGLGSSTTDLDIIGTGTETAFLSQITAAINGTILAGRMTCLEVPVGGIVDIDLYGATGATGDDGVFDSGIGALTETALITAGASWTLALTKSFSAIPAANSWLYLCGGAAGTPAAYTAGKFLIELEGYVA